MKPIGILSYLIFIRLFFCSPSLFAQTPAPAFQGSLSYVADMQIHAEEPIQLTGTFNVKMNNTWKVMEINLGEADKHVEFINTKENIAYTLFSFQNEVFYIADTMGDSLSSVGYSLFAGFEYNSKTWKKSAKKQKIQGRKCTEYIISDEDFSKTPRMQIKVYVDEKAKETENFYSDISGMKGLPVKMELISDDFNMHLLLDKVENRTISDKELNLPKEREIIDRADFMEITRKAGY